MKPPAQHTPGPWRYTIDLSLADEASAVVTAPDGSTVAIVVANGDAALSAAANAAFIVRACNAHDALVEALEAIQARVEGEWDHPALLKVGALETDTAGDCLRIARSALALARQEGGAK